MTRGLRFGISVKEYEDIVNIKYQPFNVFFLASFFLSFTPHPSN